MEYDENVLQQFIDYIKDFENLDEAMSAMKIELNLNDSDCATIRRTLLEVLEATEVPAELLKATENEDPSDDIIPAAETVNLQPAQPKKKRKKKKKRVSNKLLEATENEDVSNDIIPAAQSEHNLSDSQVRMSIGSLVVEELREPTLGKWNTCLKGSGSSSSKSDTDTEHHQIECLAVLRESVIPHPALGVEQPAFLRRSETKKLKKIQDCFSILPPATMEQVRNLPAEDREVLAYMITRGTNDSVIRENHDPAFRCGCFFCYESYWDRLVSSPNSAILGDLMAAYDDALTRQG